MINFDKEIESAFAKISERALMRAKERCPVRTGRLRDSITLTAKNSEATIGTDVEYAAIVELGGGGRGPRNYLGGAADDIKSEAVGVIMAELRNKRGN